MGFEVFASVLGAEKKIGVEFLTLFHSIASTSLLRERFCQEETELEIKVFLFGVWFVPVFSVLGIFLYSCGWEQDSMMNSLL